MATRQKFGQGQREQKASAEDFGGSEGARHRVFHAAETATFARRLNVTFRSASIARSRVGVGSVFQSVQGDQGKGEQLATPDSG